MQMVKMPAFSKAAIKPFTKTVISKGYGYYTPQDGSVCKIKVIADDAKLLSDVDENQEKEIVIGDVDEAIDRILEDCIRTMKEEEVCRIKFQHPFFESFSSYNNSDNIEAKPSEESVANDVMPTSESENLEEKTETDSTVIEQTSDGLKSPDSSSSTCIANDTSPEWHEIELQLLAYTREPEIWEMSVTEKWRRANYHKQKGLDLYARGAYQFAFRRFGQTLKYVISLEHDIPSGQDDDMDLKGLKLSCYLNIAACQMRHHNFESVVINATKALEIQPDNAKALYRRGSAYLQLQEYEKSKEDLTKAQQLEPKNQAIAKQQQLLKCQVQKLNQYYASAMKKMFS